MSTSERGSRSSSTNRYAPARLNRLRQANQGSNRGYHSRLFSLDLPFKPRFFSAIPVLPVIGAGKL